ncbi:hypothetical protein PG993_004602 [Apiospora rasikravindrae]|uniref:Uncharacterized protein n=1 Tax=Apiospora rasikravindrae TaxID=990691 RepID=A0ABR1TD88_9PEZI
MPDENNDLDAAMVNDIPQDLPEVYCPRIPVGKNRGNDQRLFDLHRQLLHIDLHEIYVADKNHTTLTKYGVDLSNGLFAELMIRWNTRCIHPIGITSHVFGNPTITGMKASIQTGLGPATLAMEPDVRNSKIMRGLTLDLGPVESEAVSGIGTIAGIVRVHDTPRSPLSQNHIIASMEQSKVHAERQGVGSQNMERPVAHVFRFPDP